MREGTAPVSTDSGVIARVIRVEDGMMSLRRRLSIIDSAITGPMPESDGESCCDDSPRGLLSTLDTVEATLERAHNIASKIEKNLGI